MQIKETIINILYAIGFAIALLVAWILDKVQKHDID